jgi:hypothetical protein
MKFKDIETTPEEVIQSLKDVGIEILEPGDPGFDEALTFGEQIKTMLEKEVILDKLYNIVVELDARETSNNCVVDNLQQFSWDELCDKGIELFEKLKT